MTIMLVTPLQLAQKKYVGILISHEDFVQGKTKLGLLHSIRRCADMCVGLSKIPNRVQMKFAMERTAKVAVK
jgi:hypothetical protein